MPSFNIRQLRLDATLSSTHEDHVAAHYIDGNLDTFCHSEESDSPWLSIHLPVEATVGYVQVVNRADCCQDRLTPFQLWTGMYPGDYGTSTSSPCGVFNLTIPPYDSSKPSESIGPFAIHCQDAPGDYVTLHNDPASGQTIEGLEEQDMVL